MSRGTGYSGVTIADTATATAQITANGMCTACRRSCTCARITVVISPVGEIKTIGAPGLLRRGEGRRPAWSRFTGWESRERGRSKKVRRR